MIGETTMTQKSWQEIGEIIEVIPEGIKHFYRLSYLQSKKLWVCSIDGIEVKSEDPREAIEMALNKHGAHFAILGFHLEIGQPVQIIEHSFMVTQHSVVGFDEEYVMVQENAWTVSIAYKLKDYQKSWFLSKEEAYQHIQDSRNK
jgi:hypothetical protein